MNIKNMKLPIIIFFILLLIHAVIGSITFKAFINITAIEIILAGIFLSVIISFSFDTLLHTIQMIKKSFKEEINYEASIHKVYDLSVKIKKDGVLSIQSDIDSEENIFLRDAMTLLNDYKKPEVMREIMEKDIESRKANFYKPHNVLKMIAHVSPSFGLIGTLLGMVGLLSNIHQTDMIMSNMASALISTLYGSLISNFIAVPLMGRMKEYIDQNILQYRIIMEGILLISQNDTARNVFDKMNVMLKEDQRLTYPKKTIESGEEYGG
ncbi:motility protein A [Inediibacterium massiliense]|uniref:motility protein A n=1 Tax=Inediibacterium massiliense TaxID=1658111 RepID=UPI0006B54657|nr:MotA/TolQ/ExbB proton channel family protein [Inediibacterium massiliense]